MARPGLEGEFTGEPAIEHVRVTRQGDGRASVRIDLPPAGMIIAAQAAR